MHHLKPFSFSTITFLLPFLLALPFTILAAPSPTSFVAAQPTGPFKQDATGGAWISGKFVPAQSVTGPNEFILMLSFNFPSPILATLWVSPAITDPYPSSGSSIKPPYYYITQPEFEYGIEVTLSPSLDSDKCSGGSIQYKYAGWVGTVPLKKFTCSDTGGDNPGFGIASLDWAPYLHTPYEK